MWGLSMADQNEREAVAQDLDIDEKQSDEVTGGASINAAAQEQLAAPVADKLPKVVATGPPTP
jgi:hypothetical protein